MSGVDGRMAEAWKSRVRETGSRVLSAVGNLATPVDRPARSDAHVSTLVAAVTAVAGAAFLLIMLITWLTR